MGIDWHTARFLIHGASTGVSFGRTLTLGSQSLLASPDDIAALFRELGFFPAAGIAVETGTHSFLGMLGAREVLAMDASPYEGASVIHDLNLPLGDGDSQTSGLRGSFDCVIDGGTLEHVFNFPIAIKNAMEMVRVGGHLIIQTPANNYFGHGFYQFSPELFFRVLSSCNGFSLERMVAFEVYPRSQWYEVADPASLGARVELVGSAHRVLLLIRAKRTHEREILQQAPQQSDYAVAWRASAAGSGPPGVRLRICSRAAAAVRWRLRKQLERTLRALPLGVSRRWMSIADSYRNRRLGFGAQPCHFRKVDC